MESPNVLTKTIRFLGLPVSNVPDEELEARILELLRLEGRHQIVFVSLWDILNARLRSERRKILENAALVIPVTKAVQRGAAFSKAGPVTAYMPFSFIIKLLGILEKHRQSVYLIGAKPDEIQRATANLRTSFPNLTIVGRFAGHFKKGAEEDIILAIRKASPSLLLAGSGIRGNEKWVARRTKDTGTGLSLWSTDCFEIFAGKRRKTNPSAWNRGLEWVVPMLRHPWRVLRFFRYLWYSVLLVYYRIRRHS